MTILDPKTGLLVTLDPRPPVRAAERRLTGGATTVTGRPLMGLMGCNDPARRTTVVARTVA